MNVLKGRYIDRVIVLGSGMSISSLNKDEIAHINRCKYVIALNKFMAFYQKAGILPTHVYFHDTHGNSFSFFKYLLEVCKKNKLTNLTFFTCKEYNEQKDTSLFPFFKYWRLRLKKKILKEIIETDLLWLRNYRRGVLIKFPRNSNIYSFDKTNYLRGGNWAENFDQPIFHYRGSLTSVLNVCSILFPNKDIFLVGADFNVSTYFFEDEINKLNFEWKDYTFDLVKKQGVHFSYQQVEGTKMEDMFPFILESLKKTGNNLYCVNSNSLLAKSGVEVKSLL